MLDKKNQDGPQEDLDDILKDFDEQDELHQRIQEFKKKKEASSVQQEELKERGQIQEEPEEAKTAIEQLKAMQEEKKETEELEQTKVSVIPRQEKAPEDEPAEDEANATVIISEDEMKRLVEEEERQKQDKKAEKKKKKKKSSVGAEVSEEEASRFNKIITIVIAAVVVIGIIIGIIFAVVSTGGDDGTDKSRLENLITQVEELDQNDYTEDEWTALQNALEEAKAVFDDEDATQDAVDEAYNALQDAYDQAGSDDDQKSDTTTPSNASLNWRHFDTQLPESARSQWLADLAANQMAGNLFRSRLPEGWTLFDRSGAGSDDFCATRANHAILVTDKGARYYAAVHLKAPAGTPLEKRDAILQQAIEVVYAHLKSRL